MSSVARLFSASASDSLLRLNASAYPFGHGARRHGAAQLAMRCSTRRLAMDAAAMLCCTGETKKLR